MRGAFLSTSPYTKPAMDGGWRRHEGPRDTTPMDTTLNAGDRLLHDGGEQPWEAKGFHAGPAG